MLTDSCLVLQNALAERGDALQHKERSLSEAARAAEQRASSLAAREGKVQGLEAQLAQLQAERSSLQLKQEVLASTEAEVGLLKPLDGRYSHLRHSLLVSNQRILRTWPERAATAVEGTGLQMPVSTQAAKKAAAMTESSCPVCIHGMGLPC